MTAVTTPPRRQPAPCRPSPLRSGHEAGHCPAMRPGRSGRRVTSGNGRRVPLRRTLPGLTHGYAMNASAELLKELRIERDRKTPSAPPPRRFSALFGLAVAGVVVLAVLIAFW